MAVYAAPRVVHDLSVQGAAVFLCHQRTDRKAGRHSAAGYEKTDRNLCTGCILRDVSGNVIGIISLKIVQNEDYFKFSIDSILLAEYVKITKNDNKIIDLCTGNLPIPFILNYKYGKKIDAVEIQKEIYNYGLESLEINDKKDWINYYNEDVKNLVNILEKESYDVVTCNPPYFKDSIKNDNLIKSIARHEIKITLEDIFNIASSFLNDKGEFYMVHRAYRLDEIIIMGNKYNLNVKNIELIKTKEEGKPYIVLVRCIRNSKLGIKINHEKNIGNLKTYQNMFKEDL